MNIFSCFAEQARARPGAVAVIDEHGQTSYGDLAARADAIARYLLANGLTPEQPVGVLMRRRSELLAVLLGVWKAGGAYVPFDLRDPVDRICRMQASCSITLFLGDQDLLAELCAECDAAGGAVPHAVDPATIPPAIADAEPLACREGGERLAYLLFTSGSSGEPKAVEVEHRQVAALLKSACELLKADSQDRYLAASTIAFDASVTELYLPLVTGASLVLRDHTILLDPHRLAREVRVHRISVLQTGPSVWQVVLREVSDFPRVRVAITHGEAVAPELALRISAQGDEVWNLYGPTETTVWATAARLRPDDLPGLSTTSAPIGRPLPHVRAFILDDQGNPVPDGTAGELCIGGPGVARGYRNNDALTLERFVTIAGERVYRSGDVVVRDTDKVLYYFGRNDDQIKVRGVRVEPGEVEAAILRDPRVAQAAATWFARQNGARGIVAAVVLQPGASCHAQELHARLAERLPSAMIPARFLFVACLPLTNSGKVDRKSIRQAAEASEANLRASAESHTDARPLRRPLTYTEHAVARAWQRILGVSAVAPDDHFFTIGGDSLTAVQMMVELEARFGLVLPVHLAFEAPTVEALARHIERAQQQVEDDRRAGFVFPLVPGESGIPIFFSGVDLSLARRGVWTLPCPLFAITNWAAGSGFVQAKSLPALAAAHLATIRQVQPKGPYRLAGYSMGGLIAFEMAQQLRRAGEVVDLLFLLDPMAPHNILIPGLGTQPAMMAPPPAPRDPLKQRIARHLRRIAQGPGEKGLWQWFRMASLLQMVPARRRPDYLGWIRYVAVNQYLRHPNAAWRLLFPRNRWRAFWFAAQRMIGSYTASPYDGRVVAVFCQQGPKGEVWNSLLGTDTQRHILTASHLALFEEPALGQWMRWLSGHISSAGHG